MASATGDSDDHFVSTGGSRRRRKVSRAGDDAMRDAAQPSCPFGASNHLFDLATRVHHGSYGLGDDRPSPRRQGI